MIRIVWMGALGIFACSGCSKPVEFPDEGDRKAKSDSKRIVQVTPTTSPFEGVRTETKSKIKEEKSTESKSTNPEPSKTQKNGDFIINDPLKIIPKIPKIERSPTNTQSPDKGEKTKNSEKPKSTGLPRLVDGQGKFGDPTIVDPEESEKPKAKEKPKGIGVKEKTKGNDSPTAAKGPPSGNKIENEETKRKSSKFLPTPNTRSVQAKDLEDLSVFVQNASLASGKMPSAETIFAVVKSEPTAMHLAELIDTGSLVLTNIKQREGIWAYARETPNIGGLVLTHTGVETLTAQEFAKRMRNQ